MKALPVHGHVIPMPSHVMFIGRNTKLKEVVVIFRGGHKGYAYSLGDNYNPRLCCLLSKHPQPGTFVSKFLRKFPTEILD
jgi:hypothetical protein